uniref:Uncharacterized protein n=1 Tax=Nicotiana tabacum TaxID=4097 RepID=A0A1S4CWU1_TOBAC|nr:PREDICTED: uncharacterized protein LOC107823479 [Nicotiana tabacum]
MTEASESQRGEAVLPQVREANKKTAPAELEAARKKHADLIEQVRRVFEVSDDELDTVANDPNPQVQKKLDQIEQLQAEVDAVKAEAEEWKRNMDRLASEKETARAQLTLAEVHLRAAKEKALELEAAKSEVVVVKAEVDERVDKYKADAEAAQDFVENTVEHMKWQSRREAVEEVHARGFDLSAEIKDAKVLEAMARKLADPEEEDSEDSGESEGGGDPDGDDAAPTKTRPHGILLDVFVFCFLHHPFVKAVRPL